jgi:hypothetical protein
MSPGMVEAEAAVFISSAIVVSYAVDQGAHWQAAIGIMLFVCWNEWLYKSPAKKRGSK